MQKSCEAKLVAKKLKLNQTSMVAGKLFNRLIKVKKQIRLDTEDEEEVNEVGGEEQELIFHNSLLILLMTETPIPCQ